MGIDTVLAKTLLLPAINVFLVIGCIMAIVVGLALLVRGTAVLTYFSNLNRWISTEEVFEKLDRQLDIDKALHRNRRLVGAVIILGAAGAMALLLTQFNLQAIVVAFKGRISPLDIAWIASSARWLLILGNVAALLAGILLLLRPQAVQAFETRMNRWYSGKPVVKNLDTLNFLADRWVEAHPRIAGVFFLVLGVSLAIILGAASLGRV
ncbi:MAG: hypothetical protein WBM28_17740 [Burkholderiales bacterium]